VLSLLNDVITHFDKVVSFELKIDIIFNNLYNVYYL